MVTDGGFSDVDKFFEGGESDVESTMARVGKGTIEGAKADHTYKNQMKNLESSNEYETGKDELTLSNTADHTSYVKVKGLDILSGSALRTEKKLKEASEWQLLPTQLIFYTGIADALG